MAHSSRARLPRSTENSAAPVTLTGGWLRTGACVQILACGDRSSALVMKNRMSATRVEDFLLPYFVMKHRDLFDGPRAEAFVKCNGAVILIPDLPNNLARAMGLRPRG